MMMMMMMMNKSTLMTLTWHVVLRPQGHVTAKKESHSSGRIVSDTSRSSCKTEQKARSSSLLRKTGKTFGSTQSQFLSQSQCAAVESLGPMQ